MSAPADTTAHLLADLATLRAAQQQAVGLVMKYQLQAMIDRLEKQLAARVRACR
jgi:hypothetical protein